MAFGDLIADWERKPCQGCGHIAWVHVNRAAPAIPLWSICHEADCPCREFEDVASLYPGGRA